MLKIFDNIFFPAADNKSDANRIFIFISQRCVPGAIISSDQCSKVWNSYSKSHLCRRNWF